MVLGYFIQSWRKTEYLLLEFGRDLWILEQARRD